MTEREKELGTLLSKYSEDEFNYIDTKDITKAADIDYGITGVYMEATVVFLEIKNLSFILKQHGRRKAASTYTMLHTVAADVAKRSNAFVNCYSPYAILVVYPGKEESCETAVKDAMRIAYAVGEAFKQQFEENQGIEVSMGIDHGHIMGTKNLSDNGYDHISWFGNCIHKAMYISRECARPFYVGISGTVYRSIGEDLLHVDKRILGLKKRVDVWTKTSYQFDNVKKHLYQTNRKLSLDET